MSTEVTPQKRSTTPGSSDDSHDDKKVKKPGRKPITTEATTKRTAQNRAAQRAFRERKQQYLKGLEDKVKELAEQQERTERENQQLKKYVDKLKKENSSLKSGKFTYEEPPAPVDFDKAISELFDSSSSSGLNLSSAFDLQQAALQGADLTKPGAMGSISSSSIQNGAASSASPQSVPNLYPGLDLSSATAGTLASSFVQSKGSASSALTGQDALLSATPSSLTNGFSNDILNSIQMLASNQNISTGSFVSQLFDSPANSSSSNVPITPVHYSLDTRSSSIVSGLGATDRGSSNSPSLSSNAATQNDMFVPLSSLNGSMPNGILSFGAFKQQGTGGFADFASLIQQTSSGSNSQTPESAQAITTPSFSELLTLSPTKLSESLISVVPTSADSMSGSASLPALLQQSAAFQSQLAAAAVLGTNSDGASQTGTMPDLPPHLLAYRNPDPVGLTDDGDQLEKLLLNNLNSLKPMASTASTDVSASEAISSLTSPAALPTSIVTPTPADLAKASTPSAAQRASKDDNDDDAAKKAEAVCTCRKWDDDSPCDPCPKHGSPADISDEIKDMAPQMLDFVCTKTNRLADDELNDLCSLMYKHAKCSEVQRRVEMERQRLKMESEIELFQTKQNLAKQFGLH
ncbi:hypothetical protein GGI12_000244 [Dipsacomyces acuminosporus]|nr:hypothetical protein GGI12_000244 [Dipsacomyces acuminosporus]